MKQLKAKADDGGKRFNERVYAQKLLKQMPPIRTVGKEWYEYDGAAWMESTREQFLPQALLTCPKPNRKARYAQNLLDHVEAQAQVRPETLIGFHRFDFNDKAERSILLNAANGVVRVALIGDVTTITLDKHKEDLGFTGHSAAQWNEKAECPLFMQTLTTALPDPSDRALFQVFCGTILWPSAEFETALISYGEGGTSKSTLAQAVANVLQGPGDAGSLVTSLSMPQICDSRSYSLPKLGRAALNLCLEVDTIDLDESTNFKQLVSGEAVEARAIYGKPKAVWTTAKLWFLANSLPRFKTGTDAELRRLRFLVFDQKTAEDKKDTTLKARLLAERDGIFRWMVEGLVWLMENQRIPAGGEKSQKILDKFAVSNDPVGTFVKRRCVFDAGARTAKDTLQAAYEDFLDDHGLPHSQKEWFFRRLFERWSSSVRATRTSSGTGAKERKIVGLKLTDEAMMGLVG